MYQKPALQRFGNFRELTQLGLSSSTDGATFLGTDGATTTSPGCFTTWTDGSTYEIGCSGPSAS